MRIDGFMSGETYGRNAVERVLQGEFDFGDKQSPASAPEARENPDNPKDKFGAAKPSFTFIPPAALAHEAVVMALGAQKYGPFNWRAKPVKAKTYVDAAIRHLLQWADGEEADEQSEASHLAHARACCGILIDALERGNLIDDRHKSGDFTAVLGRLTKPIV